MRKVCHHRRSAKPPRSSKRPAWFGEPSSRPSPFPYLFLQSFPSVAVIRRIFSATAFQRKTLEADGICGIPRERSKPLDLSGLRVAIFIRFRRDLASAVLLSRLAGFELKHCF